MEAKRCVSCMQVISSPVCPHCGYPVHSHNESHQLPVGTLLRDQYLVGRVLGQGGFGITYLGWDRYLDVPVAIKEFYPSSTVNRDCRVTSMVSCNTGKMAPHYAASKERFLREAKALAQFADIPEIVGIRGFIEENNTAYIIMEYVKGVDLAKYIQRRGGRLSADETFRILRPVMQALANIHRSGLVHRDISPDNIILHPMGGAKLLDFGAVRSVENADAERELTKSTEAILKHGFAPIEQYQTRGSLGPWTDEYAMCATVYYCLTGRIIEDATTRMAEEVDPDWSDIPDLTDGQRSALAKGLSVRARDRYPDMDSLIRDLFPEPVRQEVTPPAAQPQAEEPPPAEPQPEPAKPERIAHSRKQPKPAASQPESIAPSRKQPEPAPIAPSRTQPGPVPSSGKQSDPPAHSPKNPDSVPRSRKKADSVPNSGKQQSPAAPEAGENKAPKKPIALIAAIAAVLVVVILAAVLLPGLLGGKDPSERVSQETQSPTEAPTIAVPVATEPPEPVELTWYMVGNGMPANYDSWKQALDAYLEEKINVHLNIVCVPWGDWAAVRSSVIATGEPFDIMFTDSSTYVSDSRAGVFADLSELIGTTPGLTDLIPQAYFDACRVDGVLYGIPTYKDSSVTHFFAWTEDHVNFYLPDYAQAHTLAEIDSSLRNMKYTSGNVALLLDHEGIPSIVSSRYDACGLEDCGIGISYNGGTEFVAVFEQEDVLADLAILNSWYQGGLINANAAELEDASGVCSLQILQGWPSAASTWSDDRGTNVVVSQFGDSVMSNDTVLGSLNAISAASEHQAEALQLLELVNTDHILRDMLGYGEEGVNFEYVEENGERRVQKLNTDWTLAAYTQGTFFNWTPEIYHETNYWVGEVQVQNEIALASPALGFHIDTANIEKEINACRAIYSEYSALLLTGTKDPAESASEMMYLLRLNGLNRILKEVNAQYTAWLANQ